MIWLSSVRAFAGDMAAAVRAVALTAAGYVGKAQEYDY